MGHGCAAVVAECVAVAGRTMRASLLAALALVAGASVGPASAQTAACRIVCAPELKIEPTFTVENLFSPATVETLEDGRTIETSRAKRDGVFELIFALDVPTTIPRVGVTLEAIFVPFGETDVNPFTGVSAGELGRSVRDNGIEIEAELNISLVDTEQTGGWLSSHVDIVDKFSPADEPGAGSTYTHKLNFEWDTAVHAFNRLPEGNWLRNVEAEVSLDYVATGLPKAGDVLGNERFLQDASPWSISFVLVMPLVPLVP